MWPRLSELFQSHICKINFDEPSLFFSQNLTRKESSFSDCLRSRIVIVELDERKRDVCVWFVRVWRKRSGRYRKSFQMWRDALTINACIRGRRQGPAVDSPSGVSLILPSSDTSVPLEKNTICRVLKTHCLILVVSFFFSLTLITCCNMFFSRLFFWKDSFERIQVPSRTGAERLTRWLELIEIW